MLFFIISCKTKQRFNNEDYSLINKAIADFKDTTFIGEKKFKVYFTYDSIILNKKCKIKNGISVLNSLDEKKKKFINAQKNCITGKSPYVDSIKTSLPCLIMKNLKKYIEITLDKESFLNSHNNYKEKVIFINKSKLTNKNIIVVDDEIFNFRKVNNALLSTKKPILKLSINGIYYNEDKTLAFIKISFIEYYSETSKYGEGYGYFEIFRKNDNVWKSIGWL